MQILGEVYMSVKKENGQGQLDEGEYVRVDTKSSRAREGR